MPRPPAVDPPGGPGDPGDPAAVVRRLQQVMAGIRRAGAGEPTTGDLLDALSRLRAVREQLAGWEPELAAAARERGASWAALAPALGVGSRQAAERRFLRLQPSATGEATGEARVRAERDRRAGDRAVASWARRNAGPLRRLAAQVGAVDALPPSGRRRVDRVQEALGDDDPVSLLGPLAATQDDLGDAHGSLAEQIRSMTAETTQLRRDAVHQDRDA
jgi:hypothetical protein